MKIPKEPDDRWTPSDDSRAISSPPSHYPRGTQLASMATRRATSRQRAVWTSRVTSWDTHGSPALANVTAAVLGVAKAQPGDVVIDLGAGTGQLSLPLARQGAEVLAVDVSPVMVNALRAKAASSGLQDLHGLAMPIEVLDLPAGAADLIISSYALHHLRDADK